MSAVGRTRRVTAVAAAGKIKQQARQDISGDEGRTPSRAPVRRLSRKSNADEDAFEDEEESSDASEASLSEALSSENDQAKEPPRKRRRVVVPLVTTTVKRQLGPTAMASIVASIVAPADQPTPPACLPPARKHSHTYHQPQLLHSPASRAALLSWFDATQHSRCMPWRKPFIDAGSVPAPTGATAAQREELVRAARSQRAYEVWISEVMLQQTRVAVAARYWSAWMAQWPTLATLAAAPADAVLSAWRGLGYYGRARRVHEAARLVVADAAMRGALPEEVAVLVKRVPGVGRYTAGAIAGIVFGRAEAMVDGNVLRVLSRQLGVYADVKGDKAVIDLLWAVADALVKAVARDGSDAGPDEPPPISDRPGRWGQALMELGSTVCTPRPNCAVCPISSTCRAYGEGKLLAGHGIAGLADVEDSCEICYPFGGTDAEAEAADTNGTDQTPKERGKPPKGRPSSRFFKGDDDPATQTTNGRPLTAKELETVVDHAARFPLKVAKKAVPEQEMVVCAIRRPDGRYLIQRRPEKGLLAGLWELPSHILPASNDSTKSARKAAASSFVAGIAQDARTAPKFKHLGELGCVPWAFSHLRVSMHVHLFSLDEDNKTKKAGALTAPASMKWTTASEIDDESMGTGMRKCWAFAKGGDLG